MLELDERPEPRAARSSRRRHDAGAGFADECHDDARGRDRARGDRWGAMPITMGAIVLFGASAVVTWDLCRATTVALLLAVVGVLAHAVAALVRRESREVALSQSP